MLNKPAGYVTATRDSRFPTVMDLLPSVYRRRVVPVGRLDKDTEGLLLLTDDGELAHRLIGAASGYRVEDVAAFAAGLILAGWYRVFGRRKKLRSWDRARAWRRSVRGSITQVRRMLAARGMPVSHLERRGGHPGRFARGQVRLLTQEERRL